MDMKDLRVGLGESGPGPGVRRDHQTEWMVLSSERNCRGRKTRKTEGENITRYETDSRGRHNNITPDIYTQYMYKKPSESNYIITRMNKFVSQLQITSVQNARDEKANFVYDSRNK